MTEYRRPYQERPARSSSLRPAKILLVAGFVLLILWLVVSGWRLAQAASSLQAQQQRVEALLEAGVLNADATEMEEIARTVRHDVTEIERVVGPFAPLGIYFGWLPRVGPLLANARPLLDMADAGSELAIYAVAIAKPVLAEGQVDQGSLTASLPQALSSLDQAGPQLRQADLAAQRLLRARDALDNEDSFPDSLATLISRFDENAGLLRDGLKLAQVAPALLGFDGPRTYLILAQNEDELRPTGGFISGAGRLTVDQGRIVAISFDDTYAIDDWQHKPYDLPPEPFTEFMGMDIFLFRDANFWPDFAQSAAQAQALYTYGQNTPLDGVVAIDQQFLQQLLSVTGPLPVPDLERVIDAGNVINQLREEWGPGGDSEDWIGERKAFMGPLADAFLTQWDGGSLSVSPLELVEMLQQAAQQRHLQIYSADPAVARLLDMTVWSGRLVRQVDADFLHVSDTNMGFNKVNATVRRWLDYRVDLDEGGRPVAQLDVHYANPPAAETLACRHGTRYDPETQYESLTSDCYWNYLRVYVPPGSELTWSSQHPVPATQLMSGLDWPGVSKTAQTIDGALTYFDNFILLATGQEATVSFQYTLPNTVLKDNGRQVNYSLQVRKQAGTSAEEVSIQVAIPDKARLRKVTPQPTTISDNTLLFKLALENDIFIDLTYTR